MKILSVIDSASAYGKERANIHVARSMRNNGAEVILAINSIADASITEEVCDFTVTRVPFPRNLKGRFRAWQFTKAAILTIVRFHRLICKERPDYVLIPTEIALTYLSFALLGAKTKVVFRCGDSPLVYRKQGIRAIIYGWIWRWLIVNRIDIVVCNAKFIQQQVAASGRKPHANDVLIYNYPPERAVCHDDIEYQNCKDGVLRIGYMGRIVADKGVRELMQASLMLLREGNQLMVYIGGGTDNTKGYKQELENLLADNAQYEDCFQFIGNVKDLQKFYRHVDVVAIPSVYPEPMANVVVEAKFFHRPVVIFNQGGMPEIVRHQKDGYICQNVTIESLADGLRYYAAEPARVLAQGEQAYQSVQLLGLTKEDFTEKWNEVFTHRYGKQSEDYEQSKGIDGVSCDTSVQH